MASITTWNRLEPLPRTGDLDTSLQARVADPAWLLARQWQVGEFAGEDAGSPVVARITASDATVDRIAVGPAVPGEPRGTRPDGTTDDRPTIDAAEYDDRVVPLETVLEAEPASAGLDERLAVSAGLHLVRMLRAAGHDEVVEGLVERNGFEPGPEPVGVTGTGFRAVARGRAPDARRVSAALREDRAGDVAGLPTGPGAEDAEIASVRAVLLAWLAWFDAFVVSGAGGWDPSRMEYTATVGATVEEGDVALSVDEVTDGRLDWHAFTHRARHVTLDGVDEPRPSTTITRTVIPTPASWPGRPVDRFWEFEDGRVDLGAVDAGPADLLRMVLVEFGLASGHDWFVVPLDLRAGSLCTIRELFVTDTFGTTRAVPPIPADDWALFELSGATHDVSRLWLPPVVAGTVEGDPIESVTFLRDELANLAWAIEERVPDATGDVHDRTAEVTDPGRAWLDGADVPDADLRYRLATPVPDNWFPLVPVPTGDGEGEVVLERRTLRRGGPDGSVEVEPTGRILEPGRPLRIAEEEVAREGIAVERTWQLARWTDGSTHLWLGRRRRVGRGEGHSGLRFDVVEPLAREPDVPV